MAHMASKEVVYRMAVADIVSGLHAGRNDEAKEVALKNGIDEVEFGVIARYAKKVGDMPIAELVVEIVKDIRKQNRFCNLTDIVNREVRDRELERHGCAGETYETCICCGKMLKFADDSIPMPKLRGGRWLRLLTTCYLSDYNGELPDSLEQGMFAIGNDCYKKFCQNAQKVNAAQFISEQAKL